MSYKWPDKDKDEIVDYSVDWSRFLKDDTITSATWYIKDTNGVKQLAAGAQIIAGLQFVADTISGSVVTARFSLGENNVRYDITCSIATDSGLQYERVIFLRVKEK